MTAPLGVDRQLSACRDCTSEELETKQQVALRDEKRARLLRAAAVELNRRAKCEKDRGESEKKEKETECWRW